MATRSSMLGNPGQDLTATARAKGASEIGENHHELKMPCCGHPRERIEARFDRRPIVHRDVCTYRQSPRIVEAPARSDYRWAKS